MLHVGDLFLAKLQHQYSLERVIRNFQTYPTNPAPTLHKLIRNIVCIYVVQPKSSRNLNAARKPLVVQLWASRYRELYPL
jgi:hypothetical protein